jgi:hypothetical protein
VPRDRKGEFNSAWLPDRKGQDPELEAVFQRFFPRARTQRCQLRAFIINNGYNSDMAGGHEVEGSNSSMSTSLLHNFALQPAEV